MIKNGGRVMKNVTGYDVVKLMAGSWGTLGVLTELSFKVLAIPETEMTLVARGPSDADGVALLSTALGSPFDVTGAAHLGQGVVEGGARTQVRIEGLAASVAYRRDRLTALLPGVEAVEGADSAALWREVRDVDPFAGQPGSVWKVSVRPSDGPVLCARLGTLVTGAIYDWGGGLVWLRGPEAGDGGASRIRAEVATLGGHATLVRGPEALRRQVPVFPPETAGVATLTAGLQAKYDPRGVLNPGLMG